MPPNTTRNKLRLAKQCADHGYEVTRIQPYNGDRRCVAWRINVPFPGRPGFDMAWLILDNSGVKVRGPGYLDALCYPFSLLGVEQAVRDVIAFYNA